MNLSTHLRRLTAAALWASASAATALTAACDDGAPAAPPWDIDDRCRFAVVNTDYLSTSVSLLRADGTVCAASFITSGDRKPGVVTALSGDIALPTSAPPSDLLALIDRYPAAVITLVAPSGEVVRQLPVGTGFPANPHDVLFVAEDRAWVSRHDTNPTPTAAPGDFDEGGDVLVVDPSTGAVVGRIALDALASPGMQPRPDRLARVGERVWLTLGNLNRPFDDGGPGRVAVLDPARAEVVGQRDLDGLASCGGELAVVSGAADDGAGGGGDAGAWLTCTGVFAWGERAQVAASGVVWLAADADGAPVEGFRLGAGQIGAGRALGTPLAVLDDHRVVVVSLGTLEGEADSLWVVDRTSATASPLGVTGEAFSLNALFVATPGALLVADASPRHPALRRFTLAPDGAALIASEGAPVASDPVSGLEPRGIGRFR